MLKTNKQTTIDCHDWDDFVQKTYGRPYCFQQQDGCKSRGMYHLTVEEEAYDFENDTVPEVVNHEEMGVSFKAWLARDPKQPLPGREDRFGLDLWWNRNFYPTIEKVASDLYKRGLLEAGNYLIIIDW